jgi:hypothetical protein
MLSHYNTERPHEALHGQVPDDVYVPSPRRPPKTSKPLQYPPDCEVRRVCSDGTARLTNLRKIDVGKALAGENVGFRWLAEQRWEVFYAERTVGIYDCAKTKMIGRTGHRVGRKSPYTNGW